MKIDIFNHILPSKYWEAACKKHPALTNDFAAKTPGFLDLDTRFRAMERHPDVLQVLTIGTIHALDDILTPDEEAAITRLANDEVTEMVFKYPDKFVGAVANLPTKDMDNALLETDRAIKDLKMKGVQLVATLFGDPLSHEKYWPLYQKMVEYDLPIWIHPSHSPTPEISPIEKMPYGLFAWPLATAINMLHLVVDGVFDKFPGIKFITHHTGGVVPYLEGRIRWLYRNAFPIGHPAIKRKEQLRNFYNDTAACGVTSTLMCGYDYFGADHLLFGTDAPFPPCGLTLETIDSINRMNIPDDEKEKIFSRNAIDLLNIAT